MIRIGIIGYGYWGPRIARNFHGVPECELAVISDNNPDMLRAHGYLATQGEVIVHKDHAASPVAKFTNNGWLIIGHFEYDRRERQIVFTPEEA